MINTAGVSIILKSSNYVWYLSNINDALISALLPTPEDKKPIVWPVEETTPKGSNDSCVCDASLDSGPREHDEAEILSQINFENELHNRVYIKRYVRYVYFSLKICL